MFRQCLHLRHIDKIGFYIGAKLIPLLLCGGEGLVKSLLVFYRGCNPEKPNEPAQHQKDKVDEQPALNAARNMEAR